MSARRLGESTQRKRHLWWMLWRGIRKRCPHCAGGRLFRGWFTLADHCPTCGYRLERQEGFSLGGMAINIIVTEGIFAVVLIGTLIATVPDVPVLPLMIAGLAVNLVVPVVFYPFSLTTWAAVDLAMRPLEPRELADARARLRGEPAPRRR